MARPKKVVDTEVVQENSFAEDSAVSVQEEPVKKFKPEPMVIVAPGLGSLSEVMGSAVDPVVESKPKYKIFDYGVFLEELDEESDRVDFYLEENKKQLQSWVVELSQPPADANEIIFMNHGPQLRKYISYVQFRSQNGYAPKEPEFTSWIHYYMKKYEPTSAEEIAVQLKGNLRYSFEIIQPEEK
jgi:hypothetical protein